MKQPRSFDAMFPPEQDGGISMPWSFANPSPTLFQHGGSALDARNMARLFDAQEDAEFFVRNIVLADGRRARMVVHGNIRRLEIFAPGNDKVPDIKGILELSYATLKLWIPEGLLLTPHSLAAPFGYGAPRIDPETDELINVPFGTLLTEDTERLNQVLINRYQNNRYPSKGIYQFMLEVPLRYLPTKPPLFETYDLPVFGAIVPSVIEQSPYTSTWTTSYLLSTTAVKGDTLLCHWPEERLGRWPVEDAIYKGTNALRAEENLPPLHRPLRGFGDPAVIAVVENVVQPQPGTLDHNSEAFRTGSEAFTARNAQCFGDAVESRENIALTPMSEITDPLSAETGDMVVAGWASSPAHYANILNAEGGHYCYGGLYARFDGAGEPSNTQFEEVEAAVYAQVFANQERWLYAGRAFQNTAWGAVSWEGPPGFLLYQPTNGRYVCYRGQAYFLKTLLDYAALEAATPGSVQWNILGAGVRVDDDNRLWLMAIVFETTTTVTKIVAYTRPVNSTTSVQIEDGETYEWLIDAVWDYAEQGVLTPPITCASFSPDGTKAVLTMQELSTEGITTHFELDGAAPGVMLNRPLYFDFNREENKFWLGEPDIVPLVTAELINGVYTHDAEGTINSYRYYDSEGVEQALQIDIEFHVSQQVDHNQFEYTQSLRLSDDTSVLLMNAHTVDDVIQSDYFFSKLLYINPVTKSYALLKVDVAPVPPAYDNERRLVSLVVNGVVKKVWPEQELESILYSSCGDFLPNEVYANGVYLPNSFASYTIDEPCPNIFSSPALVPVTQQFEEYLIYENGSQQVLFKPSRCPVGEYPICMSRRYGHRPERVATQDGSVLTWTFSGALHQVGTTRPLPGSWWWDKVIVHAAEYDEEIAMQIELEFFWEVYYPSNHDIIISTSFNSDIIGIGALTSITPLGVI